MTNSWKLSIYQLSVLEDATQGTFTNDVMHLGGTYFSDARYKGDRMKQSK